MARNDKLYLPYQTRGRFTVESDRDTWKLVDNIDSSAKSNLGKTEAMNLASFARFYVKKHGDIDVVAFPNSLNDELSYDEPDRRGRLWGPLWRRTHAIRTFGKGKDQSCPPLKDWRATPLRKS